MLQREMTVDVHDDQALMSPNDAFFSVVHCSMCAVGGDLLNDIRSFRLHTVITAPDCSYVLNYNSGYNITL